jgi:hypothetical protein
MTRYGCGRRFSAMRESPGSGSGERERTARRWRPRRRVDESGGATAPPDPSITGEGPRQPGAPRSYLVVVDELDVVDPELLPGDDVVADDSEELLGGEAGGVVVVVVDSLRVVESTRVSGDAEGEGTTRSRSVTRSVLSVQPASTPTPSARTQKPVSNFFIVVPPVVDSNPWVVAATGVPPTGGLLYAGRLARRKSHRVKENSA